MSFASKDKTTLLMQFSRISPKLYAGDFDLKDESRSWYVILEDLGDDHSMPDFSKGLSLEQVL